MAIVSGSFARVPLPRHDFRMPFATGAECTPSQAASRTPFAHRGRNRRAGVDVRPPRRPATPTAAGAPTMPTGTNRPSHRARAAAHDESSECLRDVRLVSAFVRVDAALTFVIPAAPAFRHRVLRRRPARGARPPDVVRAAVANAAQALGVRSRRSPATPDRGERFEPADRRSSARAFARVRLPPLAFRMPSGAVANGRRRSRSSWSPPGHADCGERSGPAVRRSSARASRACGRHVTRTNAFATCSELTPSRGRG